MRIIKIDLTEKTKESTQLEKLLKNKNNAKNKRILIKELIQIFGYNPVEEIIDILKENRLNENAKKELLNAYSAKEINKKEEIKNLLKILDIKN